MAAASQTEGLTPEEAARRQSVALDNFWELRRRADVYYAYSYIHSYIQEPFTTLLPENVFNCALYLWNILASSALSGQTTAKMLSNTALTSDEFDEREAMKMMKENGKSGGQNNAKG